MVQTAHRQHGVENPLHVKVSSFLLVLTQDGTVWSGSLGLSAMPAQAGLATVGAASVPTVHTVNAEGTAVQWPTLQPIAARFSVSVNVFTLNLLRVKPVLVPPNDSAETSEAWQPQAC